LRQDAIMTKHVDDTPFFEPHDTAYDLDASRPLLARCRWLRAGRAVRPHHHPRGQLAWAPSGVLRLISGASVWIVPPSHAVWVPGGVEHQVVTDTDASVHHLFVHPDRPVRLTDGEPRCCVLTMTPLVRALLLRAQEFAIGDPDGARGLRLGEVLIDEIDDLPEAPFSLPGGRDARLVRLTRHLGEAPDDSRSLAELAAMAGASVRTLERLFREETGLSYKAWRARSRLFTAIERLDAGASATETALAVGYTSTSAFVAAFRKAFGAPPQRFMQGRRALS
jgi:AraC-like DNA-binding protein